MTAEELTEARRLVEHLEYCVAQKYYFEISAEDARVLAEYIRELEREATKLRSL